MITIMATRNGRCTKCGGAIVKGEHMGFERGTVIRWCEHCVNKAKSERTFKKQEAHLKRYVIQ